VLDQITPMVLTFNEAPNIARTLDKLAWATSMLVIDSGSTDATLDLVARYPQARLVSRTFDTAAAQCNFGLDQIQSEWVLSLDADYELSDALVEELCSLRDDPLTAGYRASFVYRIHGKPLRGGLYPPRTVLYRRRLSRYVDEGHTQRIVISGSVQPLKGVIFHDDRKPLTRWLASQTRYSRLEAEYLLAAPTKGLSRSAQIRRMGWPAPFLVFAYVLLIKGCALDGWSGWLYALQRLLAETMTALELADQRLRQAEGVADDA